MAHQPISSSAHIIRSSRGARHARGDERAGSTCACLPALNDRRQQAERPPACLERSSPPSTA
eukprot:3353642-Prymnesium_polylepis.1